MDADQRSEPRFEVNEAVSVVLLEGVQARYEAKVENASGTGLALEMPVPVVPGAAIKIELRDAMMLGEVIYCRQADGRWHIGIRLEQVLRGLTALNEFCTELEGAREGETSRR